MMLPYLLDNQMSSQYEPGHQAYRVIRAMSPDEHENLRSHSFIVESQTQLEQKVIQIFPLKPFK